MKLCGPKEWCFEHGECWGHLGNVICKHLYEQGHHGVKCSVYKRSVDSYTNQKEYDCIIRLREGLNG